MSTSVLYRALGIRGYQHQAIKQDQGEVTLRMRHDGSELKCPGCGGTNVSRRGTVPRRWAAPPSPTARERRDLAASDPDPAGLPNDKRASPDFGAPNAAANIIREQLEKLQALGYVE